MEKRTYLDAFSDVVFFFFFGGGDDGMRLLAFVCVAFFVTCQDSTAQKSGAIKMREKKGWFCRRVLV